MREANTDSYSVLHCIVLYSITYCSYNYVKLVRNKSPKIPYIIQLYVRSRGSRTEAILFSSLPHFPKCSHRPGPPASSLSTVPLSLFLSGDFSRTMASVSPLKPHTQLSTSRLISFSSPRRTPPLPLLCSLTPSSKRKALRRLRWRCQVDVKGNGSLSSDSDSRLLDKVRAILSLPLLVLLFSSLVCAGLERFSDHCFCIVYQVLNSNHV